MHMMRDRKDATGSVPTTNVLYSAQSRGTILEYHGCISGVHTPSHRGGLVLIGGGSGSGTVTCPSRQTVLDSEDELVIYEWN